MYTDIMLEDTFFHYCKEDDCDCFVHGQSFVQRWSRWFAPIYLCDYSTVVFPFLTPVVSILSVDTVSPFRTWVKRLGFIGKQGDRIHC
mgnify:FL=1